MSIKVQNSYEILKILKTNGYIADKHDRYWWPNSGSFEVVVGTILTQQTKWQKVEKSLKNLKNNDLLSLQAIANIDIPTLATFIKPSGFYNTKAKRLKQLSYNIVHEFGDFENFKKNVSREWLLDQKGVGFESADSILCYACFREVFVIDSYTHRLLYALGYEFEDYHDIQEWMVNGIKLNLDSLYDLYGYDITLHEVYARFHGKIVEFAKDYIRGKKVDTTIFSL